MAIKIKFSAETIIIAIISILAVALSIVIVLWRSAENKIITTKEYNQTVAATRELKWKKDSTSFHIQNTYIIHKKDSIIKSISNEPFIRQQIIYYYDQKKRDNNTASVIIVDKTLDSVLAALRKRYRN